MELESISAAWLLNVQSINPSARSNCRWKIHKLKEELEHASGKVTIPFVALTETWLQPHIDDAQISIPDYTPY